MTLPDIKAVLEEAGFHAVHKGDGAAIYWIRYDKSNAGKYMSAYYDRSDGVVTLVETLEDSFTDLPSLRNAVGYE